MATTQAQRASLFNTLAEMMGQQEAETLVEQLPPTGWDTMATKDDVRVLGATLTAALAEGLAQAAKERAAFQATMATGLADAAKERAEITRAMAEGLADAASERAEIVKTVAEGLAEAAKERAEIIRTMADGFAEAASERAEIVKSQARSLYVTVSTVVLASISIWIALLAGPGA